MIDLNDPQAVKEASRLNRRLRLRRRKPITPTAVVLQYRRDELR